MTGAALLLLQTLRLAAWGSYEDVSNADAWSTVGAHVTATTTRGHSVRVAAERLGRFAQTDIVGRIGAVLHPASRVWLAAEAGTTADPVFMPKNTWEGDVTVLVAARASAGVGYRRWNYVVGPVDIVMPHAAFQTRALAWDGRVYISRNPSEQTDLAVTLRLTRPLSLRTAVWVLGGAGRESYLVGAAVQSLETVTGAVGVRHNAGGGTTFRIALTVIASQPILSRRGLSLAVER